MTLKTELELMIDALFPDHVDIQFVPNDWAKVMVPDWEGLMTPYGDAEKPVQLEVEEVHLERITTGPPLVYAGMSQKTRIVFVSVKGV